MNPNAEYRKYYRPLVAGRGPKPPTLEELEVRGIARGLVALMAIAKPEEPRTRTVTIKKVVRGEDGLIDHVEEWLETRPVEVPE